ncbi:hypothetical protein [Mucilaginibacter celer]|uniref:Uncharacterized protein n=1 Tax=Mucilaginibacter celer TaxID=2305508 RepID=A0A494VSP2_9SPHI|nr:hypothetical protein [Mucilaginibacter celer]AYL93952.1 hypothetical protein HYN43_000995 [Mucilaginibacter celer]
MHANTRNAIFAIIYFAISGLITAWFIGMKFGYIASPLTIVLANFVSVFKWAAMVIAAIWLLKRNKWVFIRRVGFACFTGTCMLLTVFITRHLPIGSWQQFTYPVFLALFVMTVLCFRAVYVTGLSVKWFIGWLICLAIGMVLQTRVVLGLHPSLVTNEVFRNFDFRQKNQNC